MMMPEKRRRLRPNTIREGERKSRKKQRHDVPSKESERKTRYRKTNSPMSPRRPVGELSASRKSTAKGCETLIGGDSNKSGDFCPKIREKVMPGANARTKKKNLGTQETLKKTKLTLPPLKRGGKKRLSKSEREEGL